MKYVIAPDSFKESMSALEAAQQIAAGLQGVLPDIQCDIVPMADGGDGTSDVLNNSFRCREVACRVHDPFGNEIDTQFLLLEEPGIAWIEVAMACGLMLIPPDKRDPFNASSYGVGEMIRCALETDCKEIILSLGGTGTSDGGVGMLKALGARFYEGDAEAAPGTVRLADITGADLAPAMEKLKGRKIKVLCDVTNPLLGPGGATHVFAPQKGAQNGQLAQLEKAMESYAAVVEKTLGRRVAQMPGAGAAGGIGFALYAVCDADFVSGADYMMQLLGLEEKIKGANAVFTGEGRFDSQSLAGKVVLAVASVAQRHDVPVIVLAGSIENEMSVACKQGITAAFCIQRGAVSLETALREGPANLQRTARNVARVIRCGKL